MVAIWFLTAAPRPLLRLTHSGIEYKLLHLSELIVFFLKTGVFSSDFVKRL